MRGIELSEQAVELLYRVPALLIAFMMHELSHAAAAMACGDDTAKKAGRITLNPIKHIDPIGALLIIFARFGWAKPVPINPDRFRNRRAGMIITAAAGPVSNIVMAFIAAFAMHFLLPSYLMHNVADGGIWAAPYVAFNLVYTFFWLNIWLAAFNLLPVPPLDGSKVLFSLLPEHIYYNYILKYERYGMFLLIALSMTSFLGTDALGAVLDPISNALFDALFDAAGKLYDLLAALFPGLSQALPVGALAVAAFR